MGDRRYQTVWGEIGEEQLGFTQPHEHVYITNTIDQGRCKEICINNLPASVREFSMFQQAGGNTVVDANPFATGRDVLALKEISRLAKINIIATTGYHIFKFYPEDHWIWEKSSEQMRDLFVEELTEGMYLDGYYAEPEVRTDIKAGLIKAAVMSDGLSNPQVKKLLTAAGMAARETGSSIMVHTEAVDVLEAIDLLAGKIGVPTDSILICHVDRQVEDLKIHEAVAKTGVFMEYDTITLLEFHNNASEIRMLQHMKEQGFMDQILLSSDPTTDRMKSYYGYIGVDYLLKDFIPLLELCGFTEDDISRMMRKNPARALCFGN